MAFNSYTSYFQHVSAVVACHAHSMLVPTCIFLPHTEIECTSREKHCNLRWLAVTHPHLQAFEVEPPSICPCDWDR